MKLTTGKCGDAKEREESQEEVLDPIFDCCEMLSLENQLIELKDQSVDLRRRALIDMSTMLDSLGSSRSLITGHFLGNSEFVSQYGTDSSKWASKMRDQIMTLDGVTYSTEGQKIQDFLNNGIDGLLAGIYLKSLSRISKVLGQSIHRLNTAHYDKLLLVKSQYLPDYNHANELLESVTKFQKLIDSYVKNPKSVSSTDIKLVLKEIGIVNGNSADTKTDWKVHNPASVAKYVLALFSFVALQKETTFDELSSNPLVPIGERGWTATNISDFSRKMDSLVSSALETIKAAKRMSTQTIKFNTNAEVKEASVLIKKCIHTHKELISILGRGICAVLNKIGPRD